MGVSLIAGGTKAVIFAGSYHGKTTAHEAGLTYDAEAPPPEWAETEWHAKYKAYKEIEDIWKKGRDPKDMKRRNTAFNAMVVEALKSDIPIITAHYNESNHKVAKSLNREVRFVLIDWDEMLRRVKEDDPVFRVIGAFGYAEKLVQLGNVKTYPSIEQAIRSLR